MERPVSTSSSAGRHLESTAASLCEETYPGPTLERLRTRGYCYPPLFGAARPKAALRPAHPPWTTAKISLHVVHLATDAPRHPTPFRLWPDRPSTSTFARDGKLFLTSASSLLLKKKILLFDTADPYGHSLSPAQILRLLRVTPSLQSHSPAKWTESLSARTQYDPARGVVLVRVYRYLRSTIVLLFL